MLIHMDRRRFRVWREAWALVLAVEEEERRRGVPERDRRWSAEATQAAAFGVAMRNLRNRERIYARSLGLPVGAICANARARAGKGIKPRKSLSREERAREAAELARGITPASLAAEEAARAEARKAAREAGAKMRPGKVSGSARGQQRTGPRVDGWGG